MNTAITYEYRDGANYRFHKTVILAGEMTVELWTRIRATLALEVEGGFIAHQVGLPEVFGYIGGEHIASEEHRAFGYQYDEENDHCWHRFDDRAWTLTDDAPNDVRTVADLVRAFEEVGSDKWKVFDPAERFGL